MRFPFRSMTIALLTPFLPWSAQAADTETHTVTISDLPTTVTVGASNLPIPADKAAFGLFPEISVETVGDRRAKAKPCFGSTDEDRRIVGAAVAQALSAAGYLVVPSAPLKIGFSVEELDCGSSSKTERHTAWRLSGTVTYGAGHNRILNVTIRSGRTVESDFPPGASDNFRDIDTPQGVAVASLRDRLRDMFRSKQFQPG